MRQRDWHLTLAWEEQMQKSMPWPVCNVRTKRKAKEATFLPLMHEMLSRLTPLKRSIPKRTVSQGMQTPPGKGSEDESQKVSWRVHHPCQKTAKWGIQRTHKCAPQYESDLSIYQKYQCHIYWLMYHLRPELLSISMIGLNVELCVHTCAQVLTYVCKLC